MWWLGLSYFGPALTPKDTRMTEKEDHVQSVTDRFERLTYMVVMKEAMFKKMYLQRC